MHIMLEYIFFKSIPYLVKWILKVIFICVLTSQALLKAYFSGLFFSEKPFGPPDLADSSFQKDLHPFW